MLWVSTYDSDRYLFHTPTVMSFVFFSSHIMIKKSEKHWIFHHSKLLILIMLNIVTKVLLCRKLYKWFHPACILYQRELPSTANHWEKNAISLKNTIELDLILRDSSSSISEWDDIGKMQANLLHFFSLFSFLLSFTYMNV